jgi:hypothetical protein
MVAVGVCQKFDRYEAIRLRFVEALRISPRPLKVDLRRCRMLDLVECLLKKEESLITCLWKTLNANVQYLFLNREPRVDAHEMLLYLRKVHEARRAEPLDSFSIFVTRVKVSYRIPSPR